MPFRDIIGHRRLLQLLSRAVASGSLPPSLIFAGPDGVGKRRVALAVAQALNCPSPLSQVGELTRDACGACASCRRIERGLHPDVLTLGPGETGTVKIDQVREAMEQAAYRPFEGRRRVVIVEPADALLPQSQNALLKTLEEPPPLQVFILVTSRPDALLPTVLSRCPRVRFGPLAPDDIAGALVKGGHPKRAATAAAVLANGSLGRALELVSHSSADARAAGCRLLRDTAAPPDSKRRLEAARALLKRPAGASSSRSEREDLAVQLRATGSLLRDSEVLASEASGSQLANRDLTDDLEQLAESYDSLRTERAYWAVDQALRALERNASPKIVADWLVLQW